MQPPQIYSQIGHLNQKATEYTKLMRANPGISADVRDVYCTMTSSALVEWDVYVAAGEGYAVRLNRTVQSVAANTLSLCEPLIP